MSNPLHDLKSIRLRILGLTLFCSIFALIILGRSAWIQIIGDPRLDRLAKRQFESKILVRPRRGFILDRTGEPLAINLEKQSLAGNPSQILKNKSLQKKLARTLKVSHTKLIEKCLNKKDFCWLERHLPETTLERLKKEGIITENDQLPQGLWFVKEMKRVYPHGELAANVLGSVSVDVEGIEGVELWQNTRLTGKITSIHAIKDARGRPTFIDEKSARDLVDGEPVTLTLDASLQFSVEQNLKEALERTHAKTGTVIVMNSDSGEILALATAPSFNPNQKSISNVHRRNRAVTDGYEPGSTLKPLHVATALQNRMKISSQVWAEMGQLTLQGKTIREAEAHEKFGWINLQKLLEVSSNVGAAKLALQLGREKILAGLRQFGIGTKTELGFPGEISGWIPKNLGPRDTLNLASLGFGQGLFTTPMQMLRAYAIFANGGYSVQPTLIKSSQDTPASPLTSSTSKRTRVLSTEIAQQMTQALIAVTEGEKGTGKKASLEGFHVAGKTGTAQMVDPKTKKYSNRNYITTFIGYPTQARPPVVILTLLESPEGVYYASETAAPLFHEVLLSTVNRFSITPTQQTAPPLAKRASDQPLSSDRVLLQSAHPTSSTVALLNEVTNEVSETENSAAKEAMMPLFLGLTAREVLQKNLNRQIEIRMHGFGVVTQQSPAPGTPLTHVSRLDLYFKEE